MLFLGTHSQQVNCFFFFFWSGGFKYAVHVFPLYKASKIPKYPIRSSVNKESYRIASINIRQRKLAKTELQHKKSANFIQEESKFFAYFNYSNEHN